MVQQSSLEKVFDLLLNEGEEKASAAAHEWFIATGKTIVENILNDEMGESYFSEEDLDTPAFGGENHATADLAGDMAPNQPEVGGDEFGSEDPSQTNIGGDTQGDMGTEGGDTQVASLAADVERLKQKFDDLLAKIGDDDDIGDVGGDETGDENTDSDGDNDGSEEGEGETTSDNSGEGETDGSDGSEGSEPGNDEPKEESIEFDLGESLDDDLEEQIMREFDELDEGYELETVSASDVDIKPGTEIGTGKGFTQNNTSVLGNKTMSKKGDARIAGEPVEIDFKPHSGYEREQSPEVKQYPLRKNTMKKSDSNLEKVQKDGAKGAILNSKEGFGAENNTSTLPKKVR